MTSSLSDNELISRISDGGASGETAFTTFYERYASKIKSSLYHYEGVPSDDISDVFQETCMKIIRSADGYQGGSVGAWVRQIARNVAIDYWRKNGRLQPFGEGEEENLTDDVHPELLSQESVEDCVQRSLKLFQKAYPERYYVIHAQLDGISISEIGKLIDRSLSATKEFISQSKKKLAPFLNNCTQLLDE